ncbi:MAG: HAD-IA family hydrolase [Prevotellaceae bacterium]|jgi:beta-phosphoglucomutase-like phosphatase (HAD superfamily)|nr:HAD-IA family hydrolase [Prevotellaceae bacterium]
MHDAVTRFIAEKGYPDFNIKAFFFDMDGVLFDSMPYHAAAWTRAMRENGLSFTEYDAYLHEGRTGESTIDKFFLKQLHHPADKALKEAIYAAKSAYFNAYPPVSPVPDVEALLNDVKAYGFERYVVTGSAQESLIDNLEHYFPDIFHRDNIVSAFDVKYGKPDPEPYLIALRKAKIDPWQAIVVENAPLGVRSAVAAGIFTIGVNTGILRPEELQQEGANIVLPTMQALRELLPELIGIVP